MSPLANVQITPELEAYIASLLPDPDPGMLRLQEEVEAVGVASIGPVEGRFLSLLVRARRCHDVIELGGAVGYSTLWLARACTGTVTTTELDPDRAARARPA